MMYVSTFSGNLYPSVYLHRGMGGRYLRIQDKNKVFTFFPAIEVNRRTGLYIRGWRQINIR